MAINPLSFLRFTSEIEMLARTARESRLRATMFAEAASRPQLVTPGQPAPTQQQIAAAQNQLNGQADADLYMLVETCRHFVEVVTTPEKAPAELKTATSEIASKAGGIALAN